MAKPKPDKARAERLRRSRLAAGFASAAEAAKALALPEATYGAHENGWRGFSIDHAQLYARRFKVGLDWLLTGSDTGLSEIPVLGRAAASAAAAERPSQSVPRLNMRLEAAAQERGSSLRDLAFKTKIPLGRLRSLAGNTAEPRQDEIDKIQAALDCPFNDLFDVAAMDEAEALLLLRWRRAHAADKRAVGKLLDFEGPPPGGAKS